MSKVLLHACCAPCATYVHEWLTTNGHTVHGFFYNPNIYPDEEYQKRKGSMEHYGAVTGLPVIISEGDPAPIPGNCLKCYEQRLQKTAEYAKQNGFELISTTLLISPYQKHDIIREMGIRISGDQGIGFLYHDFREGYYKSKELSRLYGLYRQKYCGCSASLREREKKNEQVA